MEKTEKKKKTVSPPKKATTDIPVEEIKVSQTWIEFQKLIGTGKVLDMRAVLK
ncbi:hypothetical protein [Petrimonas sp.]|uniref:hypothetical protein n=1 Tax=Petrimonas sp. TaxID=2023866 RepID=UPI003F516F46